MQPLKDLKKYTKKFKECLGFSESGEYGCNGIDKFYSSKIPIIEYRIINGLYPDSRAAKIYEDGHVEIKGRDLIGSVGPVPLFKEFKKESKISPEQVQEYANRLISDGFFNLKEEYSIFIAFDAGEEEQLKLHYKGREKKVLCSNASPPSSAYGEVVEEIQKLIKSVEPSRKR